MMAPSTGNCARCGSETTNRCSGCLNAPEYAPGDTQQVFYCGRDCQTAHWAAHKAYCNPMRIRLRLLRAVLVSKALFLAYRECCYDFPVTSIEPSDGRLILYQSAFAFVMGPSHRPFPDDLTEDASHRKAALTKNQCGTVLALFSRLYLKLLPSSQFSIEGFDMKIDNPVFLTEFIPGSGDQPPHTLLKVHVRKTAEDWVMDLAGAQYGFREVLVPFDKYVSEKGAILTQPVPYRWTETTDLDDIDRSRPARFEEIRIRTDSERILRLHFALFVDQQFGGSDGLALIKSLVRGSEADHAESLDRLVLDLKRHMTEMVERVP